MKILNLLITSSSNKSSNRSLKLLFTLLIIMLHNTIPMSYAEFNQEIIGVKNGDSFHFVIEKTYTTDENSLGYYIGSVGNQKIYATQGEEFDLAIHNTSTIIDPLLGPVPQVSQNELFMKSGIVYNNWEYDSISYLNIAFRGKVISTDWQGQETQLLASWNNSEFKMIYEYSNRILINLDNEFGFTMKLDTVFEKPDYVKSEFEYRYDKNTGVLLYERYYVESELHGNYSEIETIVLQKGYDHSSVEDNNFKVSGFGIHFALFSIFAMIIILHRFRKTY